MDENLLYDIGFSHFLGIGPIRFKALIKHFNSPKNAYLGEKQELALVIGDNLTNKFSQFRKRFNLEKKLQELVKKQITVITQFDPIFPLLLKNISDPPICLYIKGRLNNFNINKDIFFGVVGTRHPTSYGQQTTRKFSFDLAQAGLVIVSGLAMGVDALAHQATLEALGKTIAVLGCGVDIIYPAINSRLYHQIIEKGGLIISEFPPGHTVLKGLFIARNRIISGLSRGVLIIEGGKDSGALITARYAAEQGREVFALPGPLTSAMSTAPNLLLKQGAKLVTSVDDIFEEFNLRVVPRKKINIVKQLTEEEKKIFEILTDNPQNVDNLAIKLQLPINQVLYRLSILEIKGVILKDEQGKYQISY